VVGGGVTEVSVYDGVLIAFFVFQCFFLFFSSAVIFLVFNGGKPRFFGEIRSLNV
jgi:hypothetical protein